MSTLSDNFKGRNIIITGAAGGLGSSVAKSFAASGANMLLTDIDFKKKNLDRLSKNLIKKYSVKCEPLNMDISNRDEVNSNLPTNIQNLRRYFNGDEIIIYRSCK